MTSTGWNEHSGGGSNPILITEGLSFGSLKANGGVMLEGSGQDVNKAFEAVNSQTLYVSFLVNVKQARAAGEYFFHLGPSELGTTFRGRVFVQSSGDKIKFGLSKSSNTPVYNNTEYELHKSYQLVLKYEFLNTSGTDDRVSLYILDKETVTEPSSSISASEGESDASNLGTVALRQGSRDKAATLTIDEIKVAKTWKEAVSLKTEPFVELHLPEKLHAYAGECYQEVIYPATFSAFTGESQLNLWSPSPDVLRFSKDGINWVENLTFPSSSGSINSPFYIKFNQWKNRSQSEAEVEFVIDNKEAEEIERIKILFSILPLRQNCSLPVSKLSDLIYGELVKVNGRVSASANEFPAFNYLQDETGGVRIQGDYGWIIGDSISFQGKIAELNQELVLVEDTVRKTEKFDNKVIQPASVLIEDIGASHGQLVQIEGASLNDQKFVFLPNTNETIKQNGRALPMRIWSKTNIDGHEKPAGDFKAMGVVGEYRGNYQLYPRKASDIGNIGEIPKSEINISKEYTFDLATWNLEWFGSPGNGPFNDSLQLANASKVLKDIDADVFILEEITDMGYFNQLVSSLNGFRGECSSAVSGGGEPDLAQRVCFIYNENTVSKVELRPLLGKTPPISGYPDSFERFWASGRLPALFVCDVSIDGVSRRLHIVGIHARANRNDPAEKDLVYQMRKKDIEVLKDSLDSHFSLASLIIAGDYNDDVDETVVSGFTESTFSSFTADSKNYQVLTADLSAKGQKSYIGYDNVIDHVTISNELFSDVIQEATALQLPFVNIDEYPDNTSDHLPVLTRFQLTSVLTANEFTELDSVVVYPNPTRGDLSINMPGDVELIAYLYDLRGDLISNEKGTKEQIERKLSRKLAKNEPAVYVLKLLIGNSVKTYKIVRK